MKAIMDFLAGLWAWITGLFGGKDEADPVEYVSELDQQLTWPGDTLSDAEVEERATERWSGIKQAAEKKLARVIERRAAEFERNQDAFKAFLKERDREKVLEAIDDVVDWELVFARYPDDVVELIYSRGTNIQLNMAHARLMRDMAQDERTERGLLNDGGNYGGLTTGGR